MNRDLVPYDELIEALYWMCVQNCGTDGGGYYTSSTASQHAINVLERLELVKEGKFQGLDTHFWDEY